MGSPITCPSYMHCILCWNVRRIRRETTKRTNFSRRFDKPDLNFQKVYTQSKSSIIRSYSAIIIHVHQNCFKLYFSTLQETCQIKNDSQTAKSHLISQNFSPSPFLSTCQRKNCQKITNAVAFVASMHQNLSIE